MRCKLLFTGSQKTYFMLENLSSSLLAIQAIAIGLFHPRFYPTGEYIVVVENNNNVLPTISNYNYY